MEEFQQRMIDEKKELDIKIVSLKDFIDTDKFINLYIVERRRLTYQLRIMRAYSGVLDDRIKAFE